MYTSNKIKDRDNFSFFSNKKIDYIFRQNVELLFMYVKNYKVFKYDQKINLNSKYIFDYNQKNNTVIITNNPEYVQIFPDSINLKIICGENGTGKTALMRLIQGKEYELPSEFFILLKDDQGNYFANNANLKVIDKTKDKEVILDKGFDKRTYIDLQRLSFQYDEPLEIGKTYINNKILIDKIFKRNLFNGFYIKYSNFSDRIDNIRQKIIKIFRNYEDEINSSLYKMESFLKFHPFEYVMLYNLCSNNLFDDFNNALSSVGGKTKTFSDVIEIMEYMVKTYLSGNKDKINVENINSQLLKFLYKDDYIKFETNSSRHLFDKNEDGSFTIKRYSDIENIVFEISEGKPYPEDFVKILKNIGNLLKNNEFCAGHCGSLKILHDILFEPILINSNGNFGFGDLSAGEQERFRIAGWLVKKMCYIENNSILLEDDICQCAHPNWSKDFLYDYINILFQLKKILKQTKKITNIVITTHSPFILSDVSKYNIECLIKNKRNTILEKETFAGNIGEMFNEAFFMTSTIGKYSEELIKEIIRYIDKEKSKSTIIKDDETCKKIINTVGDRILRFLLLDKFENRKNKIETNKD